MNFLFHNLRVPESKCRKPDADSEKCHRKPQGNLSFAFVLKMCVLIETVPKESACLASAVVKYPGVIVAVRILWTDGVCCMLS
jgi:hypothetical protein